MDNNYYIFTIGDHFRYLLGQKFFESKKYPFNELTLNRFIGKDREFTFLISERRNSNPFAFGKSDELIEILRKKGVQVVEYEILKIEEGSDPTLKLTLKDDLYFEIKERSREGAEWWKHRLYKRNGKSEVEYLRMTSYFNPIHFKEPIIIEFKGQAQKNGKPPKEVIELQKLRHRIKKENKIMEYVGCVIFIGVFILLFILTLKYC